MRSPDGATSNKVKRHLVAAYNSSIDPKGWHAEFAWLVTHSGRFTHISGHPSATGRAQDKESTPAEDRRTTTEPRNQPSQCNSAVYSSLHGTQGCHLVFFDFLIPKCPKMFVWQPRWNMISPVIFAGALTSFAGALPPWAPPWWRGRAGGSTEKCKAY